MSKNIKAVPTAKINKIIWLKRTLLAKMHAEAFVWYPKETGGLLAGYVDVKGNIVITKLTRSGPRAIHENYQYVPDHKYDEAKIARLYKKSDGELFYFGDWHTHPKSQAYMSDRDIETLSVIAKSKEARMPTPIMIILGTMPYQLKGWEFRKGSVHELTIAVY